jgi:hypothetical protein
MAFSQTLVAVRGTRGQTQLEIPPHLRGIRTMNVNIVMQSILREASDSTAFLIVDIAWGATACRVVLNSVKNTVQLIRTTRTPDEYRNASIKSPY